MQKIISTWASSAICLTPRRPIWILQIQILPHPDYHLDFRHGKRDRGYSTHGFSINFLPAAVDKIIPNPAGSLPEQG